MIVTVGPLPSQLLWNVDAAQPSVSACQHLTNLLRSLLIRTGSKYENSTFKYWLLSRLRSMADKPRPEVGKEKEKITVGQINVTRALIGCDVFESKVDSFITLRLAR